MVMKITLLNYNLYFNKGMIDVPYLIGKYAPDVLCFQENLENQKVEKLMSAKNYELAQRQPSFLKHSKEYYISTFYNKKKLKLINSSYIQLPKSLYEKLLKIFNRKQFSRNFIVSTFKAGDTVFDIYNVHLSPWAADIEKANQLKKILSSSQNIERPTIITGDFNYPYGRKRFEYIIKSNNLNEATQNIIYTFENKYFGFIPVRMKVDYVLYKKIKNINSTRLEKLNSDHYPILTEFFI